LLFVFAFDAPDTLFWRQRPRPLATVLEIRNLPTADCGSSRIEIALITQIESYIYKTCRVWQVLPNIRFG
jgi:hypothetical protein